MNKRQADTCEKVEEKILAEIEHLSPEIQLAIVNMVALDRLLTFFGGQGDEKTVEASYLFCRHIIEGVQFFIRNAGEPRSVH